MESGGQEKVSDPFFLSRKEIAAVAMTTIITAIGKTLANTWLRDMAPVATIAPPT
jgi:hypothetical protein